MATHDDTTDTTEESLPEYDATKFVRASDLRRKERYCPECGELRAGFTFEEFVDAETCDNRPMARYSCVGCGLWRHFGVLVK